MSDDRAGWRATTRAVSVACGSRGPAGSLVDTLHALSMVATAALTRDHRTPDLVSAGTAGMSALAGSATAHRAPVR